MWIQFFIRYIFWKYFLSVCITCFHSLNNIFLRSENINLIRSSLLILSFVHCAVGVYSKCHSQSLELSLSWEDPLEKVMVTHNSFFAWRVPWTEESGGLQFSRLQKWTQLSNWPFHFSNPRWCSFSPMLSFNFFFLGGRGCFLCLSVCFTINPVIHVEFIFVMDIRPSSFF